MIWVPADLSSSVIQELNELYLRVRNFPTASLCWNRAFLPEERNRLGELRKSYAELGVIGMWRALRGGSPIRAVLDIGRAIGLIDCIQHCRLTREVREECAPDMLSDSCKPIWNASRGELSFRGQLIRTIRLRAIPSNVQRILDAFERAGWPDTTQNPLPYGSRQLRDSVRSLNTGLLQIRFHSVAGGRQIRWMTSASSRSTPAEIRPETKGKNEKSREQ